MIGIVERKAYNSGFTGGIGSLDINPASAIQVGTKAILLWAMDGQSATLSSVTDNAGGNTWRVDLTRADATARGIGIASCDVATLIAPSNAITLNFSVAINAQHEVWVEEVSGLTKGAGAKDQTASGAAATKTPSCGPTGVLAQADELVVAVFAQGNPLSAWTPDAGYSPFATGFISHSAALYGIVSATAAVTASGTMAYAPATDDCTFGLVTYKAIPSVSQEGPSQLLRSDRARYR